MYRALRQFEEQSRESGSEQDSDLGTAKLRRDDGLHVQRCLRFHDIHQANVGAGTAEIRPMTTRRMLAVTGFAAISTVAQPVSTNLETGQQPMAIAVNETTNRA